MPTTARKKCIIMHSISGTVKNYAARSIEVSRPGIPFEVDGEFLGLSPLKATINPWSLKILQQP